jgi:hypothetical protein
MMQTAPQSGLWQSKCKTKDQAVNVEDFRNLREPSIQFEGRIRAARFFRGLAIGRNVGQGQSFPDAFASAVGISLASFCEKFDRLQANFRD